jgi:hypothetical protein
MSIASSAFLSALPSGLRDVLVESFNTIMKNFREGRWEPAELNGGKLCEITYTILKGYVDGKFPTAPSKPKNMVDACKELEKADQNIFPRSVRIQIPRVIAALYEIRNNRGVGHVGGDVNPNHMDAVLVVEMAKWIVAEIVRIFHNVDTATAQAIVDSLIERTIPIVWEVNGQRRVLDSSLSARDQTLLLLYQSPVPLHEKQLVGWVEHSNPAVYRRDVLQRCHKQRFLNYDRPSGIVHISPAGSKYVEENLSLTL